MLLFSLCLSSEASCTLTASGMASHNHPIGGACIMMTDNVMSRRDVIRTAACTAAVSTAGLSLGKKAAAASLSADSREGDQRLSVKQLQQWESLGYGMFIHFGMSTFIVKELPDGKTPAQTYAPDRLDVDQWVSVARDAGMKYIVLCAKHVAGHCLWPSKHTSYTVAHSGNTTDVCSKFVGACEKRGIKAGFYYCSWDNHNRFGSKTPTDPDTSWCKGTTDFIQLADQLRSDPKARIPSFTTSIYQAFQTAQITELLTQFGPITETWIDIPGILGRGYREFLYQHIADLQPETVIMMNSGIGTGEHYPVDYAWPSDLIAIERKLPPESGHRRWREIEGKRYYMPGELCDPIGKDWFFVDSDNARPDEVLLAQFQASRQRGVNVLLDVPPDRHGLIPDGHISALNRLRKNARL